MCGAFSWLLHSWDLKNQRGRGCYSHHMGETGGGTCHKGGRAKWGVVDPSTSLPELRTYFSLFHQ